MEHRLSQEEKEKVYIASGFAHPELSEDIARSIGLNIGDIEQREHPNRELHVRFSSSVRGKHVFAVQSHVTNEHFSVHDAAMEQCLMIDAAKRASAREITAITPYLAYTRSDKMHDDREPIGLQVMISHLAAAGANRIVVADPHSESVQGMFGGPLNMLRAGSLMEAALVDVIGETDRSGWMVVAPDSGAAKRVEKHQRSLGVAALNLGKMRDAKDSQTIHRDQKAPEAEGRTCLIFDDMIDTAGTLVTAAEVLMNSGAKAVYAAATHGIFSDPAFKRLKDSPIQKIVVTDTLPQHTAQTELGDLLRVVRFAPVIGKAIVEIVQEGSVSRIYDN